VPDRLDVDDVLPSISAEASERRVRELRYPDDA